MDRQSSDKHTDQPTDRQIEKQAERIDSPTNKQTD